MTNKKSIAPRKDNASVKMMEMCSVRVGSTLFGVPITHILEIVGNTHPHAIPLAPDFVGGLVHYRGEVLTTVSLRQLLGLPAVEDRQDIMILENDGGCFGLLVDAVGEVLTISSADREPNPSILDPRRRELFAGACKLPQGLLVMLDPERLDPMRLGATAA
jgi:purine-binding chemotaxis protein CheW